MRLSSKEKGFTLIELLAVIVILAVIALIVIPIVINMIEQSRKASFKDSVLVAARELDNYTLEHEDFTFKEGEEITVEQLRSVLKSSFKSGKFIINNGELEAYFITDGKYCAKGNIKSLQISKDCISLDATEPEIDMSKLSFESNDNVVTLTLSEGFAIDLESGIKEYQIVLKNGNTEVDRRELDKINSEEVVVFDETNDISNYKVEIIVINKNNISNSVEISLNKPSFYVNPEGWAQSKTVTITYPVGYTNEYSLDFGKTWLLYTEPVLFEDNGTVVARISKGSTYANSSSQIISQIDLTDPELKIGTITKTVNSISIPIETNEDPDSDIISTTCVYGTSESYGTTVAITNNTCNITGLNQGTTYYYKIETTNGAGRVTSVKNSVTTKATAVFNGNGGTNGTNKTLDVGEQLGELPSSSRSYTITYNTNSSSCTSSKANETVSYTLDGWYTEANSGTKISSTTTMPVGGKTYYAQWTSKSTTLATITRTGHTCTWNTKSDGSGSSYASGKTNYTPSSTHTLYAIATINQYTATFNGNGGTNGTSITKNYNAALGTLPTSTRDNYVFAGWFTATSGGTQVTTSTTMPAGGATYYAHWTAAKAYSGQTKAYYTTVQAAITATSSGTVKVLDNVTENLSISSGKTITLNLNGKKVTGKISNAGTTTITGNGTVENSAANIISNSNKLTITNGTFNGKYTSSAAIYNTGGELIVNGGTLTSESHNTIVNYANNTVTINGGTLEAKGSGVRNVIYNSGKLSITNGTFNDETTGPVIRVLSGSTTTITNGTFRSKNTSGCVKVDSGATAYIKGGSFQNNLTTSTVNVLRVEGTVEVSGGTFTQNSSGTANVHVYSTGSLKVTSGTITSSQSGSMALYSEGKLTISGGTFTSSYFSVYVYSGTKSITGGTFNGPTRYLV